MTEEELQSKFEFIAVQLGTLIVKVDQLTESQTRQDTRMKMLSFHLSS